MFTFYSSKLLVHWFVCVCVYWCRWNSVYQLSNAPQRENMPSRWCCHLLSLFLPPPVVVFIIHRWRSAQNKAVGGSKIPGNGSNQDITSRVFMASFDGTVPESRNRVRRAFARHSWNISAAPRRQGRPRQRHGGEVIGVWGWDGWRFWASLDGATRCQPAGDSALPGLLSYKGKIHVSTRLIHLVDHNSDHLETLADSADSLSQLPDSDHSRPWQTISQIMTNMKPLLPNKWILCCIWWRISLEHSARLKTVSMAACGSAPCLLFQWLLADNKKILLLHLSLVSHAGKKIKMHNFQFRGHELHNQISLLQVWALMNVALLQLTSVFYISDQTVVHFTDKSKMQQKVQEQTCVFH